MAAIKTTPQRPYRADDIKVEGRHIQQVSNCPSDQRQNSFYLQTNNQLKSCGAIWGKREKYIILRHSNKMYHQNSIEQNYLEWFLKNFKDNSIKIR